MDNSLKERNALVCGGTHGIGKAIALELARAGASVTVLARDQVALDRTLKELEHQFGKNHGTIALDMANTGVLAERMEAFTKTHAIDIVVNNTGGPPPGAAHESPVDAFEAAFRLHLLAYQTIARAVVPGMMKRRHGRLINIISTSVKQPLPNLGVSNTIRGAVANWAKTLANELGPHGITVNNVLPGATETERLATIIRNKAAKSGITETEAAHEMMSEIPLRRFAKPEEIAYAVAFLAGPSGAYINGINLPVDGGRTACL